jgi:soluble lytic murein transglycosylase
MKTLFSAILLSCLLCAGAVPQALQAATRPQQKRSPAKSKKTLAAAEKKKRALAAQRLRRAKRAFVASSDLKPMARQLLENRSRAAYAGVEAYARKHSGSDAGALARLVLGYAHILDREYVKAIAPLKQAKTRAGELDDYVAYFLAQAYGSSGDHANALAILRDFESKYPDSLFARDAAVMYANSLVAQDRAAEAVAVLLAHRNPPRADVELALGRAYLRAGDSGKAVEALRRVYYAMPLSAEAEDAHAALETVAGAPPADFIQRRARANLLVQGRRYREAVTEYRDLLGDAEGQDRPAIQVALGSALHRAGNDKEARDVLESVIAASPDVNCQRLYSLAEIARTAGDEARFTDLVSQLREAGAASPWFEDALLAGGNMYLLKNQYDRAIDFYRELQQRFPAGRYAAYAHWKAAWLTLRQGRAEEAKQALEQHLALYPASTQVPAAIYWRARLAEEGGAPAKARAGYQKLTARFPNYYYADLARARLHGSKAEADPDADPLLQKIVPTQVAASYSTTAPADDLRVQRSLLLRNAGMFDFAAKELQLAASDGGASWAVAETARLYQDAGQYYRALQTLKRAVPTYYSLEMEALPRFYWETLFPRPYWAELKKFAERNQLDPFLVAALIRQESEFNPGAVSRANAIGLMQLLPGTGRTTARELRVRFSMDRLTEPGTNLQLGTAYFRHMLDHFDGRLEYALAAYNAGSDRVEAWLQDGKFRDPEEFVESIPFTETREYVQAILRNASVYRRLYSNP